MARYNVVPLRRMSFVLVALASTFLLITASPAQASTRIDVPGTQAPSWMGGKPLPAQDPPGVKIVRYPRSLWPFTGTKTLDQSVSEGVVVLQATVQDTPGTKVVTCTSQGAIICSVVKQQYDDNPSTAPPADELSFVLIGDPVTPNGGILSRFTPLGGIPGLGIKFYKPTPNDQYKTTVYNNQYDGYADFPAYPLNLVADVNAVMGIVYLHNESYSDYNDYVANPDDPRYIVRQDGNTTYVTKKEPLPLLMPLRQTGLTPVANALEGPLRTVVELGYDRQDSPGTPVTARLFPSLSTVVSQLPKPPALPKAPVAVKMPAVKPPNLKQLLPKVPAFKPGSVVKSIPGRPHNATVGSVHLPTPPRIHIPHPAVGKGKGDHAK